MPQLDELIRSTEEEIRASQRRLQLLKELRDQERENAWVSTKAAAEQLGISFRTVPVWCMDGRLEGRRPGKSWMVSQKSIDAYLGGTR